MPLIQRGPEIREHSFRRRGIAQDWLIEWAKGLLFDTMIGNTDRRQNNWALLFNDTKVEMAPMVNCVNALDLGKLSKFLDECVAINCYVPLSRWRADFMLRLIKRRQEILVEVLS